MFVASTDDTHWTGLRGPGIPAGAVDQGATVARDRGWLLPGGEFATDGAKTDEAVWRWLRLLWRSIHSGGVLRRAAV